MWEFERVGVWKGASLEIRSGRATPKLLHLHTPTRIRLTTQKHAHPHNPGFPMTLEHARDVAAAAALAAGRLIRQHAGRLGGDAQREKGTHDLVTEIDVAAQDIITAHLLAAFPDHEILAEEGDAGADPRGQPIADGYRWVIDPIDGTTNFIHGMTPYCVSIGLQHRAEMVVGVIYEVSHGEMFTGVRGGGAYLNGARIEASEVGDLGSALVTTGFPYRAFEHVESYLEVFAAFMEQSQGVRRPGSSAYDLACLAAGRFDGFFETGLSPWDVAAGVLLVEEAGGRVSDYRGGEFPVYEYQMLASNGRVHDAMLALVEPMRDVRA